MSAPEGGREPLVLEADRFLEAAERSLDPLRGTRIHDAATRDRLAKLGIADQSYVEWLRDLLPWLVDRYARVPERPRILDFGCGTGELAVLMNRLGHPTIGLDVHGEHLRLARILARENGLPPSIFLESAGGALPFADGAFDVVDLHVVIEHLEDPVLDRALPELRRICRGCLYVTVPNRLQLVDDHTGLRFVPLLPRRLASAYVRLRGRRHRYGISPGGGWDVTYRSFSSLRGRFRAHGFRLELPPDELVFPPIGSDAQVPLTRYHELSPSPWKRALWRLLGALIRWTTPSDAPPQALLPYLNLIFVPE
ncbi:MAG: methyltransferase domain-containing protein [Gemmatimonadetes bacterium]|nr:class I SAM-dependent methyltransferase [Gemmatimonadota bacterium]NIR78970.1 class I SAM-dependent methyltransferase [Gemmatimonadota bacterium]NIT87619.1 class I SAM-dependent methyltransferase [Gemmatimonadota bacterium]NIU31481.1 class I SAM-dependent methyltransferase [Gemmatimonadota bacterium]NIU36148.1 methyltransferase domain-containing protein [Gemmatimonadota bacterium]